MPSERPTRKPTLVALVLLVLAPALLLAPCLVGPRVYVPFDVAKFAPRKLTLTAEERATLEATRSNDDVTEIPILVVPEMELAKREMEQGRFPGWNPYARFGAPLYANGLAGMAYPPDAALLIGYDPVRGLAWGAWLGLSIAGILAFALLRRLGLGVPAALLGALAFGIGGTMTANAHFYMRANALAWLPGLLLACLATADARGGARALGAAGLALCTAMTLLAGFPPFAVACLLAAGLWSLPLLWRETRAGGWREGTALAAWLLAGVALGALVSAVQVAPMFDFFPESNRDVTPTLAVTLSQAFDPMGLLGYVAPTAFGEPGGQPPYPQSALAYLLWTRNPIESGAPQYPHDYNFIEYTVFVGTLPLLLAMLGIATTKRALVRWAGGLVVLLFVIAAGSPLLSWFYGLPVVASVPPMRYIGPVSVLVAILAASGLQTVLDVRARRRTVVIGVLGLALAMVCLTAGLMSPLADTEAVVDRLAERYRVEHDVVLQLIPPQAIGAASERLDSALLLAAGMFALSGIWLLASVSLASLGRGRRWLVGLAVGGTAAELLLFAIPHNTGRVLVEGADETPVHRFLLEQNEAYAASGGITVARAARQVKDPVDLPPGTLFPLRIRDLNSYAFVDAWSHEAFLALYGPGQMIRRYWPRAFPDDERLERPFLDLIGLRYLLSSEELEHAGTPVGPVVEGPEGGRFLVYERTGALPRAFVVHERRSLPDDDAVIEALLAEDLDPRAAVLLTPDAEAALEGHPPAPAAAERTVRFVRDLPDSIALDVGGGPAGDLVLCDAALSGWTATIDGRPVPIVRGNLFMRTIPVPAGACRVELRYRTPGLAIGTALSAAALVALLALLVVGVRSRRAARSSDESGGSETIEEA